MAIKIARNGTKIATMSNDALEKALQNIRPRKRRLVQSELQRRQQAKQYAQEVKEWNQSTVSATA